MAPTVKVILGSIAFAIFWVLAAFQAVPFLPIGRTAGSLLGAMLMVIFQVITPDEAYKAIDLPILGLLFGTMLVTVYLEKADLFKHLTKLLSWRSMGAKDLLWQICLISAILSAFFTNDTACFVLTEFVLELARKQNLPPHPFLLALASSANIGSSATPIGNPQNLVIAVRSKITFWRFLFGILPATIVGVIINYLILLCMYWKSLSVQNDEQDATAEELLAIVNSQELNTDFESMNIQSSPNFKGHIDHAEATLRNQEEGLGFSKKACVYLVTLGMLISMLVGLDMSWTAITAALTLVVLDFKDPGPCLEKVSYSLLILFCGMFITVDGFNKTGIPSTFWEFMEPYSKIDRVSGRVVLAVVVIVLSNLASNVPTGTRVAASAAALSPASDNKAWLILAWVSTVAGNLSLLGSAANLIVCEQAHRAQPNGYNLSFWTHLKFGVPSTLIITAIGLTLIRE